jgi:Meiotically up-regulated gene 113
MEKQYVYAVQGGDLVKLGISKNPANRLKDFQPSSPVELRIIATARGNWRTERWLHKHFEARRAHNEWFAITPDEVIDVFATLSGAAFADDVNAREHVARLTARLITQKFISKRKAVANV